MAEHVECIGERRGAHRVLVGKAEEKTPIGTPRRRWKDHFKINLKEIGWKVVEYITQAQNKEKYSCEHRNEHSGSITQGKFNYLRN